MKAQIACEGFIYLPKRGYGAILFSKYVEAVMKRDLQYFISERAEHLAVVYLTRRQDLVTERMMVDYGLNLLVTIL